VEVLTSSSRQQEGNSADETRPGAFQYDPLCRLTASL
jgi:hypothetical protein